MDFPPLPRDDDRGDPIIQSSESFGARDAEDEVMGVVPGPSAPMTSTEPEEQLPGHSVQIQVEEADSPDARPPLNREEPTPPAGGSPKQVPEPKESGRPGGNGSRDVDVNVFGSDDEEQYDRRHDADEQHDADDGDDEDDEQIHAARQGGTYPPVGVSQGRGVPATSQGIDVDEEDIESEDGDERDEETGEMPSHGQNNEACDQYSSQCVLLFKVDNSSACSQTIHLTVRPKRDAEGNLATLNFKCPQSSIPCEVYQNTSATVLTLTKLDPKIPDWGDFEWFFEVIEK